MDIRISDLLRINGCITVNKYLIHAIGLNEAILYSELASRKEYFESRSALTDDEYFYNTQYDLQAATGLGEKAQRTAIGNLKSLKLIEVKKMGIPAKRYFKILDDDITNKKLLELLSEGKKKLLSLENTQDTSVGGNLKLRGKQLDIAKGSANNTKNNTKNNTELLQLETLKHIPFIEVYLNIRKMYRDKDHKRVTKDNINHIEEEIKQYDNWDKKDYIEITNDYFNELDENNDGDINYFLKAIHKYM